MVADKSRLWSERLRNEWALLPGINSAVVKARGEREPRGRTQIVLIINLGPFEQRPCRPCETILVRIVYLALVIITDNEFVIPPLNRLPIDMRSNQPALGIEVINGTWIEDRIRISSVAKRISKQTAKSELLVRRPANIRNPGSIPIIVVRTRVVGVEPATGDRIIEVADFAVALPPFTERVVRSAFAGHHHARSSGALFREDLNDSRGCVRPVKRALRPADDFDPVDIVRGDVGEVHCAG